MQFIDEAKIFVRSGKGGNGCVAFRREANAPDGGPSGGDGGRGGDVIIECVQGLNTLIDFRYTQHFKAKGGENGKGKDRYGAGADDLIIKVPVGTQVFLEDGETLLADITEVGQKIVVAKGGKGGLGNLRFKSSTNRAPRQFTPGEESEEKWLWLKLKLLSDAGLVGLPNAGKSSFLAKVSRAKPKVADYPFTTIKPKLGVVYVDGGEFVLADIPGLIEGASEGHGLGHRFLKHVERCGVILHLVDATAEDVVENYKTVRNELKRYNKEILNKHEIIALNKCDALDKKEIEKKRKKLKKVAGKNIHAISTITGDGIKKVLREINKNIDKNKAKKEEVAA